MTDQSNHDYYQQLFEDLKRLEAIPAHNWSEDDYNIINDLARAEFYEAKSHFMTGLAKSDPGYRSACIVALGLVWEEKSTEFISKLLDKAKTDPDAGVREIALFTLGSLNIKDALPLLKNLVEDDKKSFLARKTAYSQILSIYKYPPEKVLALTEKFDPETLDKKLLSDIPDNHSL